MATMSDTDEDTRDEVVTLITALGDPSGVVRQGARLKLIEIGEEALPFVIDALEDRDKRVRWEAAKILTHVTDSTAAETLIHTLMDEHIEIRWLAAEGLIALGKDSLRPLLEALVRKPDILTLREGAHHILHDLDREHLLNEDAQYVLEVLKRIEPETAVPLAANAALESLP
jgi:HEAT repeat protein